MARPRKHPLPEAPPAAEAGDEPQMPPEAPGAGTPERPAATTKYRAGKELYARETGGDFSILSVEEQAPWINRALADYGGLPV